MEPQNKAYTLKDIRLMGLRIISWDRVWVLGFSSNSPVNFAPSTPKPILTQLEELVVYLTEKPKDPGFVCSLQSLEGLMDKTYLSITPEWWAKRVNDS